MTTSIEPLDPAAYLKQTAWLRRLAARLVHPNDADDLVQETYAAWSARPPTDPQSPRGWMAQVARNLRNMQARSGGRRAQRERASTEPTPWPEPEELVARAQRLRLLGEAVEALDPPLRETVLRHYFDGQSLAEIARREGCPSATVRGRLRTALNRLRTALDEQHGGRREDWLSAFAPLAALPARGAPASTAGTSMLAKAFVAAGSLAVAAGCATMAMQDGPPEAAAPRDEVRGSKPRKGVGSSAAPTLRAASRSPTSPADPPGNAEQLRDAVLAARIARLQAEGLPADFVDEAAADDELLNIVESMMLMENAAEFATACAEATPPAVEGKLYAHVTLIGEPDIGTVIEAVTLDAKRSAPGFGEFATCVEESLFLLSVAPPSNPGRQTKTLFFDTTQTPVLTGTEIRSVEADAPSPG